MGISVRRDCMLRKVETATADEYFPLFQERIVEFFGFFGHIGSVGIVVLLFFKLVILSVFGVEIGHYVVVEVVFVVFGVEVHFFYVFFGPFALVVGEPVVDHLVPFGALAGGDVHFVVALVGLLPLTAFVVGVGTATGVGVGTVFFILDFVN